MISDVDLAWAAGLFEGEGTVRINTATKRNLGHLCASVVNTDREVIDWFNARWPGYMNKAGGLNLERQRMAWVWNVAATKAAAFLLAIRPFIVRSMMKVRIDHGLWFQSQKTNTRENRTDEYRERQWAAYMWMGELNKRGPEAIARDRAWGATIVEAEKEPSS